MVRGAVGLSTERSPHRVLSGPAVPRAFSATGDDQADLGILRRPMRSMREAYHALSIPLVARWVFDKRLVHPAYAMTWRKKLELAYRMYRNNMRIRTGTSYKAHMAMAAKLLEIPPEIEGVVVECGCWLGGSTANLSLVCDIVGRDLVVYDSFEGLPAGEPNDRYANEHTAGLFRGALERVEENVRRYGVIERCRFRKGWFNETLPAHTEPIVLIFLDVDYQASLHDCVVNLWPHLTEQGYLFTDEFMYLDYCALFFSERFWKQYFDAPPPGLMGVGTGIGVGQYYVGPWDESIDPTSIAYTRKDFYGLWDYVREEPES
jgi:O-methyltransferase